ncbi:MAG: hypothetical protein RLZ44_1038 [Pseudomonadota bacterium]
MLDALTRGYLDLHPAAAARSLARLDPQDVSALFELMTPQLAAGVLPHMAPAAGAQCLRRMSAKRAADILGRMPLHSAGLVLRAMDRTPRTQILAALSRPLAARLRLRLRFPDTVIGSLVVADVLTLGREQRVNDALRLMRRNRQAPGHWIYVLDDRRRLSGVVDLGDLLSRPERTLVSHVMQPVPLTLNARSPLHTVSNHPAWLTHDSLPVVNREGVFQGVLPRTTVMRQEQQLLAEVEEQNEMTTTRTALADVFWLAVASLFAGAGAQARREQDD